ncbi:hypothetical protein ACYOEI_05885, partial [Singulisphaera rosea]
DATIPGQLMRGADQKTEAGKDVQTDLVVQFNPKGKSNATREGDSGDGAKTYAVFLDPLLTSPPGDDPPQRKWTLPMAARYLCFVINEDEEFVTNPKGADLDALLMGREPIAGVTMNPNDASTYAAADIAATDTPLTGQRWPTALRLLTQEYGFGMSFDLTTDGSGEPVTTLRMFHNQAGDVKSLYLDARGEDFDPSRNNVGSADLERDISDVVNTVIAEGGLERYEVTLVLQCGFPSQSSDATSASALAKFRSTDPAFATSDNYDAYRLYVFDETGEGHYAPGSTTKLTDVSSLDDVFGAPGDDLEPKYVVRRRVPIGDLFSTDQSGNTLRYRVAVSTDYTGPAPGLWVPGSEHWQHVEGGVTLLTDRLGIRITVDDPNKWNIGKSSDSNAPFPDGVVKAVECQANPTTANPKFFVRLTCVIEGDQCTEFKADRRPSSPINYPIEERVDARDRLATRWIAANSEFNSDSDPQKIQDEDDFLKAEALTVQTAKEAGVFAAEITIPYFTAYYEIGDRIDQIEGRDLGLRTDGGGPGVMPVLPVVVARRWELDGDNQVTHLTLSDRGVNHRQIAKGRPRAGRFVKKGYRGGGGSVSIPHKPPSGISDYVPRSERDNA